MSVTTGSDRINSSVAIPAAPDAFLYRERCVWVALGTAGFIVGVTEVLGLFRALDRSRLLVCWAIALAGVLAWAWQKRKKAALNGIDWFHRIWGETRLERIMAAGLTFLGLATFVTAVIAPPNVWDAMTYHMARVAAWEQHKSVDAYPTNISRQLALAPFAEYAILHLQILFNSDRAANLVQWCAMLSSALVCSLIAGRLGAGRLGQRLAAVAAFTIPSGILQATGTYNDYVVALWICALAYFVLRFHQLRDWVSVIGIALSAGLAIFTKGTALIYGCPFGVAGVLVLIGHWRWKGLSALALTGLVILLINGPFMLRLHRVYGVWLYSGKVEGCVLQNEVLRPASFVSVVARNLAMHVPTSIRGILQRKFEAAHRALGLDLNDPRTTFGPGFRFERHMFDETLAQNPSHLILLSFAFVWAFSQRPRSPYVKSLRFYAACVMAAFLLFCLLLKWQKFHSRLQLPFFVLTSPVVGLWISHLRRTHWQFVLASLMLLFAVGPATANELRPWFGKNSIWIRSREDLYFMHCPVGLDGPYHHDYRDACEFLKDAGARRIGLCFNGNDWEYPARVLVSPFESSASTLWQHVLVTNSSSILNTQSPWNDFVPDYLLSTRKGEGKTLRLGSDVYKQILSNSVFRVYDRE